MKNKSMRLCEKHYLFVLPDTAGPVMSSEYTCGCRVHLHIITFLVSDSLGVVILF